MLDPAGIGRFEAEDAEIRIHSHARNYSPVYASLSTSPQLSSATSAMLSGCSALARAREELKGEGTGSEGTGTERRNGDGAKERGRSEGTGTESVFQKRTPSPLLAPLLALPVARPVPVARLFGGN